MKADFFQQIFDYQIDRVASVLVNKAREYADDVDRLANFKRAAELQNTTPIKALGGMMAKHTISVYDMIDSDKTYGIELWDEKITDHINYLILLRAALADVEEEKRNAK